MRARENQAQAEEALLHVYGQAAWHDDVYIVGNRQALLALKRAIEDALTGQKGVLNAMTNDGEGYSVIVLNLPNGQGNQVWVELAVPYSEEMAKESRENAKWPWDLLSDF